MTKKENPEGKISLIKLALQNVNDFESLYHRFHRNVSVTGRSP